MEMKRSGLSPVGDADKSIPSDEKHTGGKDAWEGFEKKCFFFKERVGEGKLYF